VTSSSLLVDVTHLTRTHESVKPRWGKGWKEREREFPTPLPTLIRNDQIVSFEIQHVIFLLRSDLVKREIALEMQDVTQFTALHSSRTLTDKFAGPRYRTPLPRPETLSSRRNQFDLMSHKGREKPVIVIELSASEMYGTYNPKRSKNLSSISKFTN